MMNSFITAEEAENLNLLVQRRIDPRLFLFCNYEPSPDNSFSPDGIFVSRVLGLYRFAVDSCCPIGQLILLLGKENQRRLRGLRTDINTVKTLRSAIAHSQSEKNGYTSQRILEDYKMWVKEAIGKNAPNSEQDYILMNNKLGGLQKRILSGLKEMLTLLETKVPRDELTDQWISILLNWYCSNTRMEIYFGCLINEYLSRSLARGDRFVLQIKNRELRKSVNIWIEKAMTRQQDKDLEKLRCTISSAKSALRQENDMAKALWARLEEADLKRMQKKMQDDIVKYEESIRIIEKEREDILTTIHNVGCREYLFRQLRNQEFGLRKTMKELDCEDVSYSMLPQDLLMYDIENRFKGVEIPERYY